MSKMDDGKEIPKIIVDPGTRTSYEKGSFFGKGGFAKCYEIKQIGTSRVYAGKIIPKKLMTKHNQREKITQEISIHRSLNHKHVVGFHGFFEDDLNIYIVLELCRKRSMMELHKRRKALTEPETRYYLKQILEGVLYLHNCHIIHRDLKLGNLFLNDNMEVKIGDFGLAAKLEFDGERKKTLCGTPNYIAPEILQKRGHSYEVDVWSIGCIMYTLLVGKPPFETSSLKETYGRIKRCEYVIPPNLKKSASSLISKMLQPDPKARPRVEELLKNSFFTSGYLPQQLPVSCLTTAPRFDTLENKNLLLRKPLIEVNGGEILASPTGRKRGDGGNPRESMPAAGGRTVACTSFNFREHLNSLRTQLSELLKTHPGRKDIIDSDDMSDPAASPFVWVSKWVDYSDKYGFGYQLCDEGVGVMFNDTTKLIMLPNGKDVHYIDRDGSENYYTEVSFPSVLEKKMKLLTYFRRYMNEHLVKAGGAIAPRECDSLSRIPYLHTWFRTPSAVVMHLTNGTLQVNFLDHTKIIMCPLMGAVTYHDLEKNIRTFRFSSMQKTGCSLQLAQSLQYALEKINKMIS
ncbi:serine/threonine-protein kinase PLK1 [Thrips palmi]|uniref:polo kinase n=1 Tax=Thrips palmi TaxID=161013 RepID=A0A6P8YDU5_THRPL|nr:serine/threonine-protein kinase PLK1 [Thrips palmi]